jgi:hypothetical protein
MAFRQAFSTVMQSTPMRIAQIVLGVLLIAMTPLVGPIPGPGGIIVFGLGLGLVLRNSLWAKKRYVDFKRRYPKPGSWADWGLRRPSAKRRDKRAREGMKLPKDD